MEEHVNLSGHPSDVTALTVTKGTDVTPVLLVTMVTHVVVQLIFLVYFMHFHGNILGNETWQGELH